MAKRPPSRATPCRFRTTRTASRRVPAAGVNADFFLFEKLAHQNRERLPERADAAVVPPWAVSGSDGIVYPGKRAMNESEGKEPVHVTQEMRKAGVLALLEIELGSGSESDIVDQVYRAMVHASRQPRSCNREPEKPDPIRESEGSST